AGDTDANGVDTVVYQQSLNGGAFTDLASNSLSGLADGDYQFRAVVTDNAGNSSNTDAIEVIVDNTNPTAGTLSFVGLDDTGHTDTTPITKDGTFTLSLAGDTDANGVDTVVYQQSLNGGAFTDLASNSLSGLADGDYQFRAVVTDNAGNSSNTDAIEVIVDNTNPTAGTLSFVGLDDTGHTDTTPITKDGTFTLSLAGDTDANGVDTVVYQQSLNGGAFTDLASNSLSGLADGDYQFRAVVTDNAGNSSNTDAIEVIVDNTNPTAGTLSFVGLDDTGHTDTTPITKDGTFTLSLAGDTDANGVDTVVYQQSLNGGAFTDLASNSLSGLADGDYQFRAVVTDNAGNSSNTDAIEVIVDNTNPTAGTLSFVGLDDTGHTDTTPITKDGTFTLSLAGDTDANGVDTVVYQQSLNGGAFTDLASNSLSGLADGDYQFRDVVTDNAGNSSNTDAIEVIVDNTNPTAGTLSFVGLDDTGHTDTTPI